MKEATQGHARPFQVLPVGEQKTNKLVRQNSRGGPTNVSHATSRVNQQELRLQLFGNALLQLEQ